MYFLIADQLLIFDRVAQTITILVNAILDDAENPAEAYENATSEIDRIVSLLEQPSEHHPVTVPDEVPPVAFESNQTKEKFCANVLKAEGIHHRRRHHPGRRFAAIFRAGQGVAAGHLPRRALRQSVAVHVFAGTGRLFARRRVAGNSRPLRGRQGGNPADCRHAPPRQNRRGRCRAGKGTARRPEGTRRARHAGGPGAQRHRARVRFRQRAGEGIDDHRALQPRHAHRVAGGGQTFRRTKRFTI